MIIVYVSGPYSKGDKPLNIRQAVTLAAELALHGIGSIVPHRNCVDEFLGWDRTHNEWLAEDCEIVSRCDAVIRIPGPSDGADVETTFAERNGIPVFTDVVDLLLWRTEREAKAGAA